MPAQAASSDSSDVASRYSHLLQPIRDLTKNWDIDVAAQLEEYLAEIERIKISFDGGKTTMNFAEAALVIQGSACVYSKKVEYLYTLVYQTLDLIASKKRLQQASSVDDQGKDKDASFRDDAAEFLLLDDIKEAKNIDLKEDEDKGLQIVPRTPLVLIPSGEKDKEDVLLSRTGEVLGSRNDFKMNTCTVHASGTLLLDLTHLSMLDGSFKRLMTSTPSAVQDPQPGTDDQRANQVVTDGVANADDMNLPEMDDNFDVPELMDDDNAIDDYNDDDDGNNAAEDVEELNEERRALRSRDAQQPKQVQQLPFKDPWKMLDPHDTGAWKDIPFKKGKPFKKPLSATSQQQKKKKRKRQEQSSEPTLIPINQFISQAFYSHASKMSKNHLKTPSFPEFEYLYWIEFRRQQTVQAKQKKLLSQLVIKEEIEELKSIVINTDENEAAQGYDDDDKVGSDGDDDDFGEGADDVVFLGDADAPETIEPMALDDPAEGVVISSYEEMVRQYVEGYLTEAQQYAQETELSRRVRDWEERIVPVLAQEDTHRPFDIHKYGEEILHSFKGKPNQDFKALANKKEPFEICRLFLATLQLANNYNVEITADGVGEEAVDTMRLKLLKTTPGNQAIATFGGRTST